MLWDDNNSVLVFDIAVFGNTLAMVILMMSMAFTLLSIFLIVIKLCRVEGKECAVEAKPVRRGFLRKGGGRHDPEDFEVVTMMLLVMVM